MAAAVGIIPGSSVYVCAERLLGTIDSLYMIASPSVVGTFVRLELLTLVPALDRPIAAKLV